MLAGTTVISPARVGGVCRASKEAKMAKFKKPAARQHKNKNTDLYV